MKVPPNQAPLTGLIQLSWTRYAILNDDGSLTMLTDCSESPGRATSPALELSALQTNRLAEALSRRRLPTPQQIAKEQKLESEQIHADLEAGRCPKCGCEDVPRVPNPRHPEHGFERQCGCGCTYTEGGP